MVLTYYPWYLRVPQFENQGIRVIIVYIKFLNSRWLLVQHKSPNSKDLKHLLPMNLFVTQMLERKWPIKSHCINIGVLDIHTLFKKSSKKKLKQIQCISWSQLLLTVSLCSRCLFDDSAVTTAIPRRK